MNPDSPPRRAPRFFLAPVVEGAAVAVALWCILFAFQLLPNAVGAGTGLICTVALGGAVGGTKFRRILMLLLIVATGGLAVVSLTPISTALSVRWFRDDPMPHGGVDAVVVLSGGLTADSAITGEALDRLLGGIELMRAHMALLLVTTTVQQGFHDGPVTSADDQARIIGLLGDGIEWIRTPVVHITRDEALLSAGILLPRGAERIAVVTSPMHTRRACATFEAVGFTVTCVSVRLRTASSRAPSASPKGRIATFGAWVYEAAAMAKYRALGWLARPA